MRGLDNQAYYCLSEDKQTYWHVTGVGNQMRANHRPFRRLILDSLRYWAEEMHIDGFRFDLAPALGASDSDYTRWDDVTRTVLQDIIDDPVLREHNVRVIAEPWATGGSYAYMIGAFPAATEAALPGQAKVGWYEWNGRFRDWWRAFMNDDNWKLNSQEGDADGGFTLTGCDRYYGANGRGPWASVNFVSVHDGMTLYDVFSYAEKKNGCGPLNPICCEDPLSVWCDLDSGENNNRSRDWGTDPEGEAMKRQLIRNLFVAMLIAHGTPMIYAGDEWMRTQLGNNNAYSSYSDNAANWLAWGSWQVSDERTRMHDFVRQVIRFRKTRAGKLGRVAYGVGPSFVWKSEANSEPPDWRSRHLMIHYPDEAGGPPLVILVNLERHDVGFTLPPGTWRRLVDTQRWFDSAGYFEAEGAALRTSANATLEAPVEVSGTYTAKDSSIVILEAAP
jgi:glycogen operon protein